MGFPNRYSRAVKHTKILCLSEEFTLKSNGTIRVKMIVCSSNCSIKKIYFNPDSDNIVKCNGKSYAKFRTCPKTKNTDTGNSASEIHYAYISVLVEMNEGYVEISVKDALAPCLSKAAIKEIRSTVYAKQIGEGYRKIELVGIEIPARASDDSNE